MQIQKTIAEFVSETGVPILKCSATVGEALALMKSQSSACVLVTESEALAGIFTDHDFMTRVAAQRLPVASTPLRDVMTKNPDTLRGDNLIAFAVNLMAVEGYRNVPIVGDTGDVVSNLTVYDVVSHLATIFSEVEDTDAVADEWTDIGGAG
ncbi:MAG: CBS domain-containing protein [Myxococcales bacterium]|nr:CBS domain-containing protein [Myxococcales bacterium]